MKTDLTSQELEQAQVAAERISVMAESIDGILMGCSPDVALLEDVVDIPGLLSRLEGHLSDLKRVLEIMPTETDK